MRGPARLRNMWKAMGEGGYALTSGPKKSGSELISKYPCPKGSVEIDLVDAKSGQVIETVGGDNLIVDLARANMSRMVVGDDMSNRQFWTMKFSDGGHDPATGLPISPVVTDTDLYHAALITKTWSDIAVSYPSTTSVRLTVTIAAGEGNGVGTQGYSELGIFLKNGQMFSHKTHGLIVKSADMALTYRYTILF